MYFSTVESDLFMRVAHAAYGEHLDGLQPCGKCGRKFFPHRILQHEANCNAKPVQIKNKQDTFVKKQGQLGTGKQSSSCGVIKNQNKLWKAQQPNWRH